MVAGAAPLPTCTLPCRIAMVAGTAPLSRIICSVLSAMLTLDGYGIPWVIIVDSEKNISYFKSALVTLLEHFKMISQYSNRKCKLLNVVCNLLQVQKNELTEHSVRIFTRCSKEAISKIPTLSKFT